MEVLIKSSAGITRVDLETKLLEERKLYLDGEIDQGMAVRFAKAVTYLAGKDRELPIKVFINSVGGEINAGLMIYDIIQTCPAQMELYCMGKAYSMAAVLLASGQKGHRYILPHGEVMLHEPLLGNLVKGNSSSIKTISDNLLEVKRQMNKILEKHTGRSEKEIEEITRYDHFFTAEESVEFGLCDRIVGFGEML